MLTSEDVARIRAYIATIFQTHAAISPASTRGILPVKDLQGKLYEAHVLATVIQNLVTLEHCTVRLINSGTFTFKQKGSPVRRAYPYFEVYRAGTMIGELFTDTEFLSLSCVLSRHPNPANGDYHELDIALLSPLCAEGVRPMYSHVLLAIECKATTFEKSTFREVLGFRRELTFLSDRNNSTGFNSWPIISVPADPPSVHMCYSTDPAVLKYVRNAATFGIIVFHETM
jgi:hypothetical protein